MGDTVTRADGSFLVEGLPSYGFYVAWVSHPKYAGIMGTSLGAPVPLYLPGQRETGVIVPGIPGGEISGRVADQDGSPIASCPLSLVVSTRADEPWGLERKFDAKTDSGGRYHFDNVDANRYYVLAECDHLLPGEMQDSSGVTNTNWTRRESWPHTFYPNATVIKEARAVTVLPGRRKTGIDFRLPTVPAFSIRGTFSRAGNKQPIPTALYENDLSLYSLDMGLPSLAGGYGCRWNVQTSNFRCDFVTPGRYRLQVDVSTLWRDDGKDFLKNEGRSWNFLEPQQAILDIRIARETPPEFRMQMQQIPEPVAEGRITGNPARVLHGQLKILLGCHAKEAISPILFRITPPALPASFKGNLLFTCSSPMIEERTPGNYALLATEASFWRPTPAFLRVIERQAKTVNVRRHRETTAFIPVLTTRDIYRLAVADLVAETGTGK